MGTNGKSGERAGLSRRQLLTAGAGMAGAVAGVGLIGAEPATKAHAAGLRHAKADTVESPASNIKMSIVGTSGYFRGVNGTNLMTAHGYLFQETSPYDASSGRPTGRRQYQPIVITKSVDGASPQILAAAATGETLKTVTIQFFNKSGGVYYQITLSSAEIVSCTQYVSDTEGQHFDAFGGLLLLLEDISFVFEKIVITDLAAKTTFQDDWNLAG